jgi:type I restriction enzyme, S subunit
MSEMIPEGWKLQPLSALAEYHNGRAFKPEDWSKEGLPIVRIAQINHPFSETDYYNGSDVLDKHLIRKGDLVFSWSATLKAILWKEYDAILNQHIFKVIEKPYTSRIFLQQLLEHSIEKLAGSSHGSTMKHIKKGVLDEFHSPIPPLPEQKKIASILTSVDEVIENTQKQIDKLQDLKKGTMNELLTKGIGHTEFKDSELGRIPKSWEVKRLKDIGECVRGLTYSPSDISSRGLLVLRSSNIQNNRLDFDDSVYVNSKIADRFKTKENDILICVRNGSRQLIGKNILIEKAPINSTHGAFMTVFRSNINLYVQYLMQSDFFYRYVSRDIGATINSINNGNLIEYQFSFPPIEEQNNIISILSSIDKNILQTKDKLLQIQSLKKSLMQDLLTGKVRVKVN